MRNKYIASLAAAAAMLGAAASVHAAGITVNSGDLILGFQDSTNSIEFDIGSVSTLEGFTAGSTHDLGFSVNTALSYSGSGTTGYGASWASNSAIAWGVAGKDSSNFYTGTGISAPSTSLNGSASTSPFTIGDATAPANSLGTLIAAMGTGPTSAQLKAGGGTILAMKYLNTSANSFSHVDPNSSATGFSNFTPSVNLNSVVTNTATGSSGLLNGLSYSALDLYDYTNNGSAVNSTYLGTLALTSGGELFFVSAVPEPSTYAAIFGVVALGAVAYRRRKQVVQAQA